jgi:hypothetical protein
MSLSNITSTVRQERQDLFNQILDLRRDLQLCSRDRSCPTKYSNVLAFVLIAHVKVIAESKSLGLFSKSKELLGIHS